MGDQAHEFVLEAGDLSGLSDIGSHEEVSDGVALFVDTLGH
jgi:hypothetical protein